MRYSIVFVTSLTAISLSLALSTNYEVARRDVYAAQAPEALHSRALFERGYEEDNKHKPAHKTDEKTPLLTPEEQATARKHNPTEKQKEAAKKEAELRENLKKSGIARRGYEEDNKHKPAHKTNEKTPLLTPEEQAAARKHNPTEKQKEAAKKEAELRENLKKSGVAK